jgi:DNA-binding IclR family transcriptional regulator
MAGNSVDAGRSVTSKVAAILLTFTSGTVYSLTELAKLTGLPISTVHRLATELAAWGFLERTEDGQYRVGMHLKVIGAAGGARPSAAQEKVRRVMEDLSAVAGRANVHLGVLEGYEVVFIRKTPGNRPISLFQEPNAVPAHASAMGKAMLAFAAPERVEQVIAHGLERYTPFTVTNADRLRRGLAIIRLTRVAVSRREYDPALSAVAAPVFGAGGKVVAALELEVRDPQELRPLQPPLIVAARSLSRELGFNHVGGRLIAGVDRRYDPRAGDQARWRSPAQRGDDW